MMKAKQFSTSYFSEEELSQRRRWHDRRHLIYRLHLFITFVVSLILTHQILANTDIFFHGNDFYVRDATASLTELMMYLPVLWLVVILHLFWKGLREKAEAQVDAVIQHYETKRSVYRLSEDGELFDDAEEMDYELKPKRKRI